MHVEGSCSSTHFSVLFSFFVAVLIFMPSMTLTLKEPSHACDVLKSIPLSIVVKCLVNMCYVIVMILFLLDESLRGNLTLSVLKLCDCQIGTEGTSKLAELLGYLPTITVFDLSFNCFDSGGLKEIGKHYLLS